MGNFSLADALFSTLQQRVLALIFTHPERSFYTREILRNVDSGTGAVKRELERLEQSGLVSSERIGNQRHYRANQASPIFEELHGLVLKTVGLIEPLRQCLAPYSEKIRVAFIYGSVARGRDTARSDIDLMVIGNDLSYSDLYTALQNAEQVVKRPFKPNFFSVEGWRRRLRQKNSLLTKVMSEPKIFIIGSENDLAP